MLDSGARYHNKLFIRVGYSLIYIPAYELICSMMRPSLSDAKAAEPASYKFRVSRPDAVLADCRSKELPMECPLCPGELS